jgi:hypothetical protein
MTSIQTTQQLEQVRLIPRAHNTNPFRMTWKSSVNRGGQAPYQPKQPAYLDQHGGQWAFHLVHVLLQITIHPLKDEVQLTRLVDDVLEPVKRQAATESSHISPQNTAKTTGGGCVDTYSTMFG